MLSLGLQNLLSPMVLFFILGLLAVWAKSDLSIPEAVAKFLALYLLLSIGFRGGAEVSHHGLTAPLLMAITAGIVLSFGTPSGYHARTKLRLGIRSSDGRCHAALSRHFFWERFRDAARRNGPPVIRRRLEFVKQFKIWREQS